MASVQYHSNGNGNGRGHGVGAPKEITPTNMKDAPRYGVIGSVEDICKVKQVGDALSHTKTHNFPLL
jgi:hypothetical protein